MTEVKYDALCALIQEYEKLLADLENSYQEMCEITSILFELSTKRKKWYSYFITNTLTDSEISNLLNACARFNIKHCAVSSMLKQIHECLWHEFKDAFKIESRNDMPAGQGCPTISIDDNNG